MHVKQFEKKKTAKINAYFGLFGVHFLLLVDRRLMFILVSDARQYTKDPEQVFGAVITLAVAADAS